MSDPFFPTLQEPALLQLRVALKQFAQHPGYLSHPSCPYSPVIVELIQELASKKEIGAADVPTFDGEGDRLQYVEDEIIKVLTDLETLVRGLGNADHSEKLQVAKARAGLIEKLVGYREKVWSMKNMADFQNQVIGFLEDICSKDQVLELKERLRIQENQA